MTSHYTTDDIITLLGTTILLETIYHPPHNTTRICHHRAQAPYVWFDEGLSVLGTRLDREAAALRAIATDAYVIGTGINHRISDIADSYCAAQSSESIYALRVISQLWYCVGAGIR